MSQSSMKTLVYEGPRIMNIRQQPIPVPEDDEVLVRVEKVGICGSELSGYLGQNSLRKPPLIMGHEFSGTIAATGSRADKFKSGDRVTANPLASCGECHDCQRGAPQLCANRKLIGAHVPGAFAEYVVVKQRYVYSLPEHVSFDEGAFAEPFAVAIRACRLLGLSPEHRLLITGAGPIGLFALQAAQVYGVREIVITDINPERLEVAKQLGGIAVSKLEDLPSHINKNGFDASIDAVGLGITRMQCIESLRPGGKVVFSGLHEADSSLPVNAVIRNEVTMQGAFAYTPHDFETAMQWISEKRVNLLPWTIHAPLEEGGSSFEKLLGNPGSVVKILLHMES